MATGQIKRLIGDRGFGFIKPDSSADELFFHSSTVQDNGFSTLQEGQHVEFEQEPDPRNPGRSRAVNVRVVA